MTKNDDTITIRRSDLERVVEALEQLGEHAFGMCNYPTGRGDPLGVWPCDCGFDEEMHFARSLLRDPPPPNVVLYPPEKP